MRVKSNRRGIGVDVEGVGHESRNIRADQCTAKRQHEAIVGQALPSITCRDGYLLIFDIDGQNFGDQMAYTYRIEHLAERDCDVAEIDLVIADTDIVIGVAVDDQYLNFPGGGADLVELASSTDSCPQTREPTTEHEDARHLVTSIIAATIRQPSWSARQCPSCHNCADRNEPAPMREVRGHPWQDPKGVSPSSPAASNHAIVLLIDPWWP